MTSKSKLKVMLLWSRGIAFVSTGNKRLWIHSGLRKIRLDRGGVSEKKSPIGMDVPDDSMFQSRCSEFCIQNSFIAAG